MLTLEKNSGEACTFPFLKIVDSFVKSWIALSVCEELGSSGFSVSLSPYEGIVSTFSPQEFAKQSRIERAGLKEQDHNRELEREREKVVERLEVYQRDHNNSKELVGCYPTRRVKNDCLEPFAWRRVCYYHTHIVNALD